MPEPEADGTSCIYKGVSMDRTHDFYKAQIKHDGMRHSLEYFNTAEEAARGRPRGTL